MDFYNPTETHAMLRQTIREFTEKHVEPQAKEYDQSGQLNRDLMGKLAELGFLGVTVPEELGGAGMDTVASVIIHHELSKSDPGFCLSYLAHSLLYVNNLAAEVTEEQRERYLEPAIQGAWIGGMGMTEPGHGTDVLGMRTTAVKDGDHYILNGSKTFITNGPEGYAFLVYAKLDDQITAFLVDRDMPGFSTGKPISKVGMRASPMAPLIFEDCRVPKANLVGEEGKGLVHMMRNLEIERLALAAMSVGIGDRCVDIMVQYGADRRAFGQPINRFGQIQRYIAESYAMNEAAKAYVYYVARQVNATSNHRLDSDAAKLFATPVGKQVADNAIQVLGGNGYSSDYPVERLWRDAKLLEIGGGTLESHQKNICKDLTRKKLKS